MAENNSKPILSIITVAYNPGKSLVKTMESILAQEYVCYEYIIQDGGSTDGTDRLVETYRTRFEEKGVDFKFISGKDGGIYDAMNKAVSSSNGEWVNFMNAGDCFYSASTLKEVFENKTYPGVGILYGDAVECEYDHYYMFRKAFEQIEGRMPFSHQSAFISRELMSTYPYNLEYKIGADYDFLLSMYKKGYVFEDTNAIICIISKDGVSSVKLYDTFVETMQIRKSNGVAIPDEKEQKKLLRKSELKQFVMDHFPDFVKKYIRRVQLIIRHQNAELTIPEWEKVQ